MTYGVWPDWCIYEPQSARYLGNGGGNVVRDVARQVLTAVSGLTLLGPRQGVVWRGQASSQWRLESKLGRLAFGPGEMAVIEKQMIAEARGVGADNAQHLGDWEILGRLRHHGAATRLIDFTTDPMVALWFLCNDKSLAPNIFGTPVSVQRHNGVLVALLRENLGALANPYLRNYSKTLERPRNLMYKIPPIDPRIAAQRGLFAFRTSPRTAASCAASELGLWEPNQSWKANAKERLTKVCSNRSWANQQGRPVASFPNVVGIAVPAKVKPTLLKMLETSYGFDRKAMFPDFEGMGLAYREGWPAT